MRNNDNKNPFVGPVPCSELDAMNFYGRDIELQDLLQKVRIQALTIITAESGAGKTSLINAGLIPALRYLREGDADDMGFALYVGKWGIPKKSGDTGSGFSLSQPANIFRKAVIEALDDLHKLFEPNLDLVGIKQLKEDFNNGLSALLERYKELKEPKGQYESESLLAQLVSDIKCALPENKLILIVDQAEEFMGSGVGAGRDFLTGTLSTLASLLKTKDVKVIISLREEYMGKLRMLEDMYKPLAPRIFHLYPLTWKNARETLCKVSSSSKCVKIGNNVMDMILGWSNSSSYIRPEDRDMAPVDMNTEMDEILEWSNSSSYIRPEVRDMAPVDMLSAQAFLIDIYDREYASMKDNAADDDECHITIDMACLKTYIFELFSKEPQIREQKNNLYIGGLLRWIDRAFEDLAVDEEFESFADKNPCIPFVNGALVRRIAANMGTVLATPRGFKSHISRGNLIFHAIRKELTMCFKKNRDNNEKTLDINDARKQLEKGEMLTEKLGYSETAIRLGVAGNIAANLLQRYNILKSCGEDEHQSVILSLQHDGYTSAITAWCNDLRRREDDALVPDVGVYGIEILREHPIKQPHLDQLRWEGCFVGKVEINNVHFDDCSFNACYMKECTFNGCTFKDCKLTGAFFSGGTFVDVTFNDCSMLGVVITEMDWENVDFIDCDLSSAVVKCISLKNKLSFKKSTAQYAQLFKFYPADLNIPQITAKEFDIFGALFEDFDERFDCKNATEYTNVAPPEKKPKSGAADS